MAASNAPSNRLAQEKDRLGGAEIAERDREAIEGMVSDMHQATTTKAAYCRCMRLIAGYADGPVSDLSPAECADLLEREADEREWSPKTLAQYQSALKAFVNHTDGEDAADEIDVERTSGSASVDPRTVLTPDEFHELRENAANLRDRCLIDLFGYTGQRLRVIQALKVRDVDVEEGVYYLPDAEGLKGADKGGTKRPLLGARKSVSDWLDMHPTGDRDDTLITSLLNGNGTPGEELSGQHINRRIKIAADRAGIDKPVNPHAFRHFFVTVSKSRYDMDDSTIKHLIGHAKGSRIMETTYAHLTDDEHITNARQAVGMDTGEDERESFTPPVCPTCGVPLRDGMDRCPTPTCNETFSPDAGSGDGEDLKDGLARFLPYLGNHSDEEVGRVVRELAKEHADEPMADYHVD